MSRQLREIESPPEPQALLAPPEAPNPEAPKQQPPKSEPPKNDTTHPAPHRSRKWLYTLFLLILVLGGIFWYRSTHAASIARRAGEAGGGRGAPAGGIPVVSVQARRGNIPVYITGLGAITPLATVTVKSRVDGQLMAVHFQEGDLVHQGDPLIDIDPRPYQAAVEEAEGQLTRDQALLANARVDLARYQTLIKEDAIPEQQLATQQSTVKQFEGTVKDDEGLLDSAKLNVLYCHITSPITGIVGLRLVDPGNIVHAADTNGMLVITQIQPISVIFTVSEDQLPPVLDEIRHGRKLPVEAWDRELKNRIATGSLETVDNEIDQTTGTLKLRAIFDNKDRALFPNQFVNARLLLQEKRGVTVLPTAAVQRNAQSTYVFLIKPDNTVTIRPITLGTTEGDESEVTAGLMPGDKVVMTGVDKLQEGARVIPHAAAAPDSTAPLQNQ